MTHPDPRYPVALDQFNQEEFFECHDTLEEIWLEDFSSDRLFYQGLIQVAVGFHHLAGGKYGAGRTMMAKALEKLGEYPDEHLGIRLAELRRDVLEWKQLLDDAVRQKTALPDRRFPKIFLLESRDL